ncbi:MAG TPA: response regulator [Steroidobacteraceae bacterium]|nr:response regulator [Steroidobacteraceae bacterium]
MSAKRALIVDDSKSARVFLARALEQYDIDVDAADSAEAAIAYLSSNRPDVIFMDHLMPGMDGLQAVQAIKNNPRTATIPIMMYTSQEGELYLGQARALGAVGVLPKQIKPTDVSKVLFELHLVPERRTAEQTSFTPVNARVERVPAEAPGAVASKPLTDSALREHFAELRRALVAGIDTQTERITGEVRALLREALPRPPEAPAPPPPRAAPVLWGWVACAALAVALMSAALWWRTVQLLDGLTLQLTQLQHRDAPALAVPAPAGAALAVPGAATLAATTPAAAVRTAAPAAATVIPSDSKPLVVPVPYGADAFGGARLELIGKLLYRLARQKVAGVVDVRSFPGRFCLVGNALDGYSLAPDETLFARCDVVGNPSDEALQGTQRTPLALANLIGDIRSSTHGALQVQVAVADAGSVLTPYPQVVSELTAGEWNRAAAANNRVEIRVH